MRESMKVALAVWVGLGVSTVARAAARSGSYSVQVLNEGGHVLPTFQQDGQSYAMGTQGHRYSLRVRNGSNRRVEFVASVDGRDVLDGKPSAWEKRGYIVNPHSEVVIDGFRLSHQAVAAFRFSSVHSSYASRMGDARDVGVIGVAVFPEKGAMPVAKVERQPFWNNAWGKKGGSAAKSDGVAPPTGNEDMTRPAPQEVQASAEAPAGPPQVPESAPPATAVSDEPPLPPAAVAPLPVAPSMDADSTPAGSMEAKEVSRSRATYRTPGMVGRVNSVGAMGMGGGGRGMSAGAPPPMAMHSAQAKPRMAETERPGLGTEFGERRSSQAEEVEFERASSRPAVVLSVHYDNKAGLLALGIDVDGRLELSREARLRRSAEPFRRNGPVYESSPTLMAR